MCWRNNLMAQYVLDDFLIGGGVTSKFWLENIDNQVDQSKQHRKVEKYDIMLLRNCLVHLVGHIVSSGDT